MEKDIMNHHNETSLVNYSLPSLGASENQRNPEEPPNKFLGNTMVSL